VIQGKVVGGNASRFAVTGRVEDSTPIDLDPAVTTSDNILTTVVVSAKAVESARRRRNQGESAQKGTTIGQNHRFASDFGLFRVAGVRFELTTKGL
jgi:hypothetical protein